MVWKAIRGEIRGGDIRGVQEVIDDPENGDIRT